MLKLAVVGKDVSLSESPAMHTFILGRMWEKCLYDKISIPLEQFSVRADRLFAEYDAFNVTIPFKGEIIPHLRALEGDARLFGAVNTVVARTRTGYNTDGFGFLLMLENAGIEVKDKCFLILGAGGAGRSCIKKLVDGGANVYVYEKDADRLAEVYSDLGGFHPLIEIPERAFDVAVNCTGIGMHRSVGQTPTVNFAGGLQPVGKEFFASVKAAVDLIYNPEESAFLRIARECGRQTVSGGPMLFYQAYCADCIFLGKSPCASEAKKLFEEYREERR